MVYESPMFIEITGDNWRAKKIIATRTKRKAILAERAGTTILCNTVHEDKEPERFARIYSTMYPGIELNLNGTVYCGQNITRSLCELLDIMKLDVVLTKLVIAYREHSPFEKAANTKHALDNTYATKSLVRNPKIRH